MNQGPEPQWATPESTTAAGPGLATSNKRRRIGLACSACRARKSRCDGIRPKCSACDEFGFECIYIQSASSSNMIVGKNYLTGLEDRLNFVEQEIASMRADRTTRKLRFEDGIETRHADDKILDSNPRNEGIEVNSDDLHDNIAAEDATDGMGAVVFSEEEDFGFFGPSSNIALTRHISHAVTQMVGSTQTWTEPSMVLSQLSGGVMSVSRPGSPAGRASSHQNGHQRVNVNIYALPKESRTRELLNHYFSTTGLLFPYLHEQTFWDTYEFMRRNQFTKVRRTWLGLLNIVLALATSTRVTNDTNAGRRVQESDVYYQRALGICENQILRASSLEAVQFLLIMGQYLQGTQKSVQAWSIHGLTVKAAFQLGLHSSVASKRFSPFEQEIRKRTWYGCVVLDRTLSMTFGRPANIPDYYVKLDLPMTLDGDDLLKTDSVRFFNSTITLYKIMWTIITFSYDGNVGCDGPLPLLEAVSELFKMEQQLVDWERSLPTSLYLRKPQGIPPDNSDSSEKFRIVLTLRYHNLRILLHRSMLIRFLDIIGEKDFKNPEVAVLQQIGANSVHICVQSSMDIITIISTIVKSGEARRGMLGAWWFTLYYTFNAALVLCASFLVYQNPSLGLNSTTIPLELLRPCIDEGAQALSFLDIENRTIDTCAKYLRRLATILDFLTSTSLPMSDMDEASQTLVNLNRQALSSLNSNEAINTTNEVATGLSPFGMGVNLGEFILDGDLEFLNQMTMPMSGNTAFTT